MIITDGHHLPAFVIKAIVKAKGVPRTIVVSDTVHLAGMPPGYYRFQGEDVILEENGLLHIPARGCLAGSTSTMVACMNYLSSLKILSIDELLKVSFYNPLKLIGIAPESVISIKQILFEKETGLFAVE
jgi:N-acetylglucosamine-6-phosphate deacetylase